MNPGDIGIHAQAVQNVRMYGSRPVFFLILGQKGKITFSNQAILAGNKAVNFAGYRLKRTELE